LNLQKRELISALEKVYFSADLGKKEAEGEIFFNQVSEFLKNCL
jgi:hypothetical protein